MNRVVSNNFSLLSNIQIFISVVELGSFSASAKELNLSQPSVSRKLSSLETHLGIRLLHRTTRSLSLTEAGKIYYERVRNIEFDLADAAASISGYKDHPSGTLRISVPFLWAEHLILPRLSDFLTKYPDIKIDFELSDDFSDLIEDRLDLVIRIGELRDTSYVMVPFGQFKFKICGTPSYFKKHGEPKNALELKQHAFIVYRNFKRIRLSKGKCQNDIDLDARIFSNNPAILLQAVQQNCGLGVLADWIASPSLENSTLMSVMNEHDVELRDLSAPMVYALYSSREHLPAKVRAFIDFFRPE